MNQVFNIILVLLWEQIRNCIYYFTFVSPFLNTCSLCLSVSLYSFFLISESSSFSFLIVPRLLEGISLTPESESVLLISIPSKYNLSIANGIIIRILISIDRYTGDDKKQTTIDVNNNFVGCVSQDGETYEIFFTGLGTDQCDHGYENHSFVRNNFYKCFHLNTHNSTIVYKQLTKLLLT